VRILLERGAEVNKADKDGVTPLALALSQGSKGLAGVLSSAGGSKVASSLPILEVIPDPMLSCLPPWMAGAENVPVKPIEPKPKNKADNQAKESIYGWLKKGTSKLVKEQDKKDPPFIAPNTISTTNPRIRFET